MAELRRDVLHPQGASESLLLLPKVVSLSCQCPAKVCVVLLSYRENGEQEHWAPSPCPAGAGHWWDLAWLGREGQIFPGARAPVGAQARLEGNVR